MLIAIAAFVAVLFSLAINCNNSQTMECLSVLFGQEDLVNVYIVVTIIGVGLLGIRNERSFLVEERTGAVASAVALLGTINIMPALMLCCTMFYDLTTALGTIGTTLVAVAGFLVGVNWADLKEKLGLSETFHLYTHSEDPSGLIRVLHHARRIPTTPQQLQEAERWERSILYGF